MSGWRRCALGDVITLRSGGTPSKANPSYWDGGLPWISSKDMGPIYLHNAQDHVSESAVGNGTRSIEPGTILMVVRSMILAREVPIGITQARACFNQDLKAVIPARDIDNQFLLYWLLANRPDILGIVDEAGHGTKRIQTDRLLALPLDLPPLPTQRRIASILGAYDDLMEVNRRRIAVLEEMARGLFEEWFVRFRFPGHEAVPILHTPEGPLPEGWSFEPLGILADIQWGDTSKTKKAYTPDGYRAYSASGPDGYMSYYDFDRTGVVLSAIGAKCGKTWLARGQWSCIKNTMRFWARDGHVSTEYLFLALSDPERWPRRGAAQPFISLGDARKIKLIRPDLPTLTRFDAMASSTLALADNLRDQNERLAASRDLLLPRLISGQLSVRDAERELEEAA